MKKQLKDLTLKEFQSYNEMLNMKKPDIFGIVELFGFDATEMPFDEFSNVWTTIQAMTIPIKGTKKHYVINGVRYKAHLNHLTLTAGQFVDFQSYMQDFKMENILSVFLVPQYRKYGLWRTNKYNNNYDLLVVQDDIFNHMKIGDAQELASFFLNASLLSLETMKDFLVKKGYQMKKKLVKQKQGDLLG